MASTISPNMSLIIPTVGSQPGPTYASNVNSSLSLIDLHDHSLGKGVQITPAGLDINSDLSMGSNDLIDVRSVVLDEQAAALAVSETNLIYNVNGDLYFNDGNGTQIPITASGSVAGTPGSISNFGPPANTASATYVEPSTTIVFQSDTNTALNLDIGSIKLRNLTVSSFALTLSPPILSANYTITLPALPAADTVMSIDASGNITTVSDDTIGQGMTSVGANAIANSRTRAIGTTAAVGEIARSNGSGSFTANPGTTFTDITNLTVTITTSGRPVLISLTSDPVNATNTSSQTSYIGKDTTNGLSPIVGIIRDSVTYVGAAAFCSGGATSFQAAPSLAVIDAVAAGTYTYKAQIRANAAGTVSVNDVKLMAYEL